MVDVIPKSTLIGKLKWNKFSNENHVKDQTKVDLVVLEFLEYGKT